MNKNTQITRKHSDSSLIQYRFTWWVKKHA